MIKRTIREVACEYDKDGRLINKIETVTEEEDDNKYNPWSNCPVCTSGYMTTADAHEAADCESTTASYSSTTSNPDEDADDLLSWIDKMLNKLEHEIKEMTEESDACVADKALKGRERTTR